MREMKNSGVAWIGEIPEEYSVVAVKNMFEIGRGRVIAKTELCDDGYPVYSSQTKNDGCLGYISTYDFDRDQLTWTTDGANAGTIFLRRGKHNCTNVCGTLLPKSNDICLEYQGYALWYIALHHKRADTNGFKIMNNEMAAIKTVVPPTNEQKKIAFLLDDKCSKVDTLIANQEAQIEKLKQYKQSLITEVVTKGLNPNAEMKDSGVEWIGEIPSHWGISRIKNSSTLRGRIGWQGLKSSDYQEEGPYLITGTDFKNGIINWGSCVHISDERFKEDENIHIRENDLLITKDGTIGKVAVAKKCPDKVSLNSGVLLVRNEKTIKYFDRYMYYLILSNVFWDWYNASQTGNSTIKHLYQGQFENFSYPLPMFDEQHEIANYLDTQCTKIDKLIEIKQSKIAKLNEYKKSLIYEYVTGKKEVC